MTTDIGGVGTGFAQGISLFASGVGGVADVASSSITAQHSPATENVSVGGTVSGLFVALADAKDAAAKTANSIKEAEKVLSGNDQAGNNVVINSTTTNGSTHFSDTKSGDSRTVEKGAEAKKLNDELSKEQAAYLAKLNIGRIALQTQLDRLAGLLDVNLQQLTTEAQAQLVGQTTAGQLAIALPPLSSTAALSRLGP